MSKSTWIHSSNTFEVNTRNSNIKMLSIASDTFSKLKAKASIPGIAIILNSYEGVFETYRSSCADYDVAAGRCKGNSLKVRQYLTQLLPEQLRQWEAAVRNVYAEDSPKERGIFPRKRYPFFSWHL